MDTLDINSQFSHLYEEDLFWIYDPMYDWMNQLEEVDHAIMEYENLHYEPLPPATVPETVPATVKKTRNSKKRNAPNKKYDMQQPRVSKRGKYNKAGAETKDTL